MKENETKKRKQHLDEEYGKFGSAQRNAFDQGYQAFNLVCFSGNLGMKKESLKKN